MKIAVLGAGFAGLATTWHLLNGTQGGALVDLFDPEPIGGGVSGLSSGLLHPYMGKRARCAWRGEEGREAAHELLTVASRAVGESFVLSNEILRPALNREQADDLKACAAEHSDTEWWDRGRCLKAVPGLTLSDPEAGGLFIRQGLTIDVPRYLQGLWQACARLGTQFYQTAVIEPEIFVKYDAVVFAIGHVVTQIPFLAHLPITPLKGQLLEVAWPTSLPPLPYSLNAGVHIVMSQDKKSCLIGSTYERKYTTEGPDPDVAIPQLREKVAEFFPPLATAPVLNVRAGIRASSGNNHLPICGLAGGKLWFITGLGSRGLLYHAWLGKALAQSIVTGNPRPIPAEIWQEVEVPTPPQQS